MMIIELLFWIVAVQYSGTAIAESDFDLKEFQKDMLLSHNVYRTLHGAPPLTMDPALSAYAQEWADELSCLELIQQYRPTNQYGENTFVFDLEENDIANGTNITADWYYTVLRHNYSYNLFNKDSRPFTQIVWNDTKEMGIGVAKLRNSKIYVVVNYKPAGNIRGKYLQNVFPSKDNSTKPLRREMNMLNSMHAESRTNRRENILVKSTMPASKRASTKKSKKKKRINSNADGETPVNINIILYRPGSNTTRSLSIDRKEITNLDSESLLNVEDFQLEKNAQGAEYNTQLYSIINQLLEQYNNNASIESDEFEQSDDEVASNYNIHMHQVVPNGKQGRMHQLHSSAEDASNPDAYNVNVKNIGQGENENYDDINIVELTADGQLDDRLPKKKTGKRNKTKKKKASKAMKQKFDESTEFVANLNEYNDDKNSLKDGVWFWVPADQRHQISDEVGGHWLYVPPHMANTGGVKFVPSAIADEKGEWVHVNGEFMRRNIDVDGAYQSEETNDESTKIYQYPLSLSSSIKSNHSKYDSVEDDPIDNMDMGNLEYIQPNSFILPSKEKRTKSKPGPGKLIFLNMTHELLDIPNVTTMHEKHNIGDTQYDYDQQTDSPPSVSSLHQSHQPMLNSLNQILRPTRYYKNRKEKNLNLIDPQVVPLLKRPYQPIQNPTDELDYGHNTGTLYGANTAKGSAREHNSAPDGVISIALISDHSIDNSEESNPNKNQNKRGPVEYKLMSPQNLLLDESLRNDNKNLADIGIGGKPVLILIPHLISENDIAKVLTSNPYRFYKPFQVFQPLPSHTEEKDYNQPQRLPLPPLPPNVMKYNNDLQEKRYPLFKSSKRSLADNSALIDAQKLKINGENVVDKTKSMFDPGNAIAPGGNTQEEQKVPNESASTPENTVQTNVKLSDQSRFNQEIPESSNQARESMSINFSMPSISPASFSEVNGVINTDPINNEQIPRVPQEELNIEGTTPELSDAIAEQEQLPINPVVLKPSNEDLDSQIFTKMTSSESNVVYNSSITDSPEHSAASVSPGSVDNSTEEGQQYESSSMNTNTTPFRDS